jgi:predicted DCC family thiol-disulfide oxidoreductase YuxK
MNLRPPHASPILFFDGVCNLCDAFVRFAVAQDTSGVFRFAPLQGDTARSLVPEHAVSLGAVVLLSADGRVSVGAEAVAMFLCQQPRWTARVAGHLLNALPRFMANSAYAFVAKRRYTVFGKKSACRVPTENEKARFLP